MTQSHGSSDSSSLPIVGPTPLRLGFVGGGRVTESCHLPAIARLGGEIKVVALAEPDEHRRQRVAGMFEIPHTFPDLASMLQHVGSSDAPIDAVAVCTPAVAHADAVLAALAAGKHVMVEKPISLSQADADRIVLAAQQSNLKVMMGFNLRHHRLVQKARRMIEQGVVGQVQLIRSLWTSGIRTRMQVPQWRSRRTSGGGCIAEIAVHHIDLARYLTGSDVAEVLAHCEHGENDDEVTSLTLRLKNGVTVSSAFTERSGDANEMEIIGDRGRLSFSIYQFDSLRFTPIGSYGGRVGRMIQSVKDLIEAWPVLRRGGDFHETYRAEWQSFVNAVRNNQPIAATVEDGRAALRTVLAAGLSANRHAAVSVEDAPQSPEPVPGRTAAQTAPAASQPIDGPQLSAILSTRGGFDSIRRTLKHLRSQTGQNQLEVVIICVSRDQLKLDGSMLDGFWGHQIIEQGEFNSAAVANAAGARVAKAPLVVFCEDHAFPDPEWARSLITSHRGPYAAVGPVVYNANPATLVSRADFLIGYGPWAIPIKPSEPHHLPGHNSCYKREVLLGYGPKLEEVLEAESVMHWELVQKGNQLYLDPGAQLAHTNFAKFDIWTKIQFHTGRLFAGTRAIGWPVWKRIFYTLASPLIPFVRFKRIWADARRLREPEARSLGVMVTLFYGLSLDGLGQMVGYAMGTGASQGIAHEYCRVNHITDEDRRQLEAAEQPGQTL